MAKRVKIDDKVHDKIRWNCEAGHVSGTIIRVGTSRAVYKGNTHPAISECPRYEIKSNKTDRAAMHKRLALTKTGDRS